MNQRRQPRAHYLAGCNLLEHTRDTSPSTVSAPFVPLRLVVSANRAKAWVEGLARAWSPPLPGRRYSFDAQSGLPRDYAPTRIPPDGPSGRLWRLLCSQTLTTRHWTIRKYCAPSLGLPDDFRPARPQFYLAVRVILAPQVLEVLHSTRLPPGVQHRYSASIRVSARTPLFQNPSSHSVVNPICALVERSYLR